MTDIVERLRRDISPSMKEVVCPAWLLTEAVDEIEGLRGALQEAEAAMSIIPPRTMKARYLAALQTVRAALGG